MQINRIKIKKLRKKNGFTFKYWFQFIGMPPKKCEKCIFKVHAFDRIIHKEQVKMGYP